MKVLVTAPGRPPREDEIDVKKVQHTVDCFVEILAILGKSTPETIRAFLDVYYRLRLYERKE